MKQKLNSRYVVVAAEYLTELMEMVDDFIDIGFVPCGGVTVDHDKGQYLQALYLPSRAAIVAPHPSVNPPYAITFHS